MKAHYQTYRCGGELCRAEGQSMVECRMAAQEIQKVIDVEARAVLLQATCENGEIKYGGKLYLTVLYVDQEGKLSRAERGAEFFHKAENGGITPACSAVGRLDVENTSVRRDGASVVIACVVGGRFAVFGERVADYLSGGEGLIVKKKNAVLCKAYTATAAFEETDEFETDYAQDILLHGESAIVTDVRTDVGLVEVTGEIALHFCALRRDGSLCTYERIAPFKAQVLCDSALPSLTATAKVYVQSAYMTADTDEEKGRSKIAVDFALSAVVTVYEKDELSVVDDAFSTEVFTTLQRANESTRYALNGEMITERIHGTPVIDGGVELEGKTPCAVVFPSATVSLIEHLGEVTAEGVIEGKVLYVGEQGEYALARLSLPFAMPIAVGADSEVDCCVCGLSVRVRAGGETEAEATLKLRITPFEQAAFDCVNEVVEGEARMQPSAGISVYVTQRGDGLWETAKRLCVPPEQIESENPELNFPLQGEERLVIYRQNTQILQK